MSVLSIEARNALPSSSFALPGKRMFPIHNRAHGQKALQLLPRAISAGSVTSAEAAQVRAAVHRRYPNMGSESSYADKVSNAARQ